MSAVRFYTRGRSKGHGRADETRPNSLCSGDLRLVRQAAAGMNE